VAPPKTPVSEWPLMQVKVTSTLKLTAAVVEMLVWAFGDDVASHTTREHEAAVE
jgi:hypothetical protein